MIIQSAAHEDANIIFGAVLDEKMKDAVKITVIATGFRADAPHKRERIGHASMAISQARTAASYEAAAAAPAPVPEQQAMAVPIPEPTPVVQRSGPERETSLDPGRVKGNFEQDDLDVPAFIRKRRDPQ